MKHLLRILIVLLSLAESVAWTKVAVRLWRYRTPFQGAGDGGPGPASSAGDVLIGVFIVAIIWLLLISPYLCMMAGSLNLITGKGLRTAYSYSAPVLSIMTFMLLVSFHQRFEFMALGNIAAGGLWVFLFRGVANSPDNAKSPQS